MLDYFRQAKSEAEKTRVEQKKESEPYFEAVKQFQRDRVGQLNSQIKVFKVVSLLAVVVIFIMAAAIAFMAPLKTAVPVLIRVDNNTGFTDVVNPITNSKNTYEEVVNKYNLARYVINYESYDWLSIQEMNDSVMLLSDGKVFSQYRNQITAENSPLNVLKQNNVVKVKVRGVTLLNADTAQVRFDKAVLNTDGTYAPEYRPTSWIATIVFDYKKKIKTEGERFTNPLGFQALSYRVDTETIK